MQDWSRVQEGHASYLESTGEMEVAFDRAATLLRRPAAYTMEATTAFREAPGPGRLEVVSGRAGGAAAAGAAIELILDASGSMLKPLGGKRRIAIAKEVLAAVVSDRLPAGTPLALRVFGHRQPNACRTDLEIPLSPLDPARAVAEIEAIQARNLARTPIADSLARVASDLKRAEGRRVVVLVTDGEETCDGDPAAEIEKLRDAGIDVTLNIVGFAIDDDELESRFETWAELGGGRYFSARDEEALSDALKGALETRFVAFDAGGTPVGEGVVDGEPIELEAGIYRVVVDGGPPKTFERVEVPGETTTRLEAE